MGSPAEPTPGRRRADGAVLAAVLALAAWLRWPHLATRELWLDEMTRVRMSLLSWDAIWHRLPYIDPMKSPYVILLHKAWTSVAGTGSLLAMRGFGALGGLALVAAAWWVARAALGRWAALAAALVFAVDPFYVRHSVEVHTYTPAALCVFTAWALALSTEEISRRRATAMFALAGFGVGTFAGVALAFAPLVAVPAVRRFRGKATIVAGAALAVAIALPALLSLRESVAWHRPAYAAGIAWSPYFSLRTTPFEVLARIGGLDVRQATATGSMRAGTVGCLALAAAALLLARPPAGARDGWWKRMGILGAGIVPITVLALLSRGGVSMFNDRYVHATASLLPIGFVGAVETGLLARGAGAAGRAASATAAAAAAVALATLGFGISDMLRSRESFPRDTTGYLYRCNALVDETAAKDGVPAVLLVHGEAQASQVLLRCRADLLAKTDLRHLTTLAWTQAERDRKFGEVTIPHAYGWPIALTEFAGRSISVGPAAAGELVRAKRTAWVVLERERVNRQRHLEDEETPVLDDAVDRLPQPASPERDAAIADAVRRYLGLPAGTSARVVSGPWIAIVELSIP